jgi:hypothetical protein
MKSCNLAVVYDDRILSLVTESRPEKFVTLAGPAQDLCFFDTNL